MAPLVAQLVSAGINILGGALMKRGKEEVEKRLGVDLPSLDTEVAPEKLAELRQLEMDHERTLIELSIRREEIQLAAEKAEHEGVTQRWQADLSSDSRLAKNIRPIVLAYLTIVITLMAFASKWLEVEDAWVELLGTAYVTVIVAYFGSRGIEKVTGRKK